VLRAKPKQDGKVQTTATFKTPLIITAEMKTDSKNIRLCYGEKGLLIFNWELNGNELRHHDPRSGAIAGVAGQGAVPKNTWVTIRWTIDQQQSRVEVDGVERAKFAGDYSGLSGTVGVHVIGGTVIGVKSLKVAAVKPADAPPAAVAATAPHIGPIEISVPSAPAAASQPAPDAPADPRTIARPEFRNAPKRLAKDLTSVTAMMVRVADDGQASGFTSDIIAAVAGGSRRGNTAGVGFVRTDGDEMMKTALEEAVRAVTLRYPIWEPGHIDLSFGEKFEGHGGPSAAAAFALLMLSTLEDFDIDPKCAVTGDLTVDWRVRKVGGVTAKLRGATLDGCQVAVIPAGNEAAFADMALLYGNAAVWDIQVFSVSTLQDVIAVARKDRSSDLAEAISLFSELGPKLKKSPAATLRDPQTHNVLKRILQLAPNHVSARQVQALCDGTAAKTLSSNATIYQLSVLFYPFREILGSADTLDREALPAHVTALARKRLAALRPIASRELSPLVSDIAAFIEALDGFAAGTINSKTVLQRAERLDAGFAKLDADPGFLEKLVREAY
jgi:hypothetical protein